MQHFDRNQGGRNFINMYHIMPRVLMINLSVEQAMSQLQGLSGAQKPDIQVCKNMYKYPSSLHAVHIIEISENDKQLTFLSLEYLECFQ